MLISTKVVTHISPHIRQAYLYFAYNKSVYGVHILNKLVFIIGKACVKEPKRPMCQRKLLNNFVRKAISNRWTPLKHQISQFYIKVVGSYGIFKSAVRFKLMCSFVCLHRTKVLNKTKIADFSKKLCSLGRISDI